MATDDRQARWGRIAEGVCCVTGSAEEADRFESFLQRHGELKGWCFYDLKVLVKDPASKVGHKEGYDVAQTQRCVYSQENFPTVINYLVMNKLIDERFRKFFLNCHSGWHRAGVGGKTVL